ncbi:MAG: hypothetical protein Ct9H90mP27_1710 [Gammaproteobacteria bacterium]|nr:MAG: hypothetical protein Ct9H90mP27_1710 [Gammaproteobacteria bacterium]
MNDYDSARLGPIETPSLVLMGDQDKMTRRAGIAVSELLPDCKTGKFSDWGFPMLSEKPKKFLTRYRLH